MENNNKTKKLKDYLHLYLGCEMYIFPPETYSNGWLAEQLKDDPELVYKKTLIIENYRSMLAGGHLPILRPLSSMTEEEAAIVEDQYKSSLNEDLIIPFTRSISGLRGSGAESFKYLIANGFDLFGLIKADLAIDATTLIPAK